MMIGSTPPSLLKEFKKLITQNPDKLAQFFTNHAFKEWTVASNGEMPLFVVVEYSLRNPKQNPFLYFWQSYQRDIQGQHLLLTNQEGIALLIPLLLTVRNNPEIFHQIWHKLNLNLPRETLLGCPPGLVVVTQDRSLLWILALHAIEYAPVVWEKIWDEYKTFFNAKMLTDIFDDQDGCKYSIVGWVIQRVRCGVKGYDGLFAEILRLFPDIVATTATNDLISTLQKNIHQGTDIAPLLTRYPLEDWLQGSFDGYPLGLLMNGWQKIVRPEKDRKLISAYQQKHAQLLENWWAYFGSQMNWPYLQRQANATGYMNQTPLFIFACAAAHSNGKIWQEIWSKFGKKISRTHFTQVAHDGCDQGKTIVWLLACAAANNQVLAWEQFWDQCHPLLTLADLRVCALNGKVSQGKTVLWQLAAATSNKVTEPWRKMWLQFSPQLTLGDLLSEAQNGPYQGMSVLLNLICAAAKGEKDIWPSIYQRFHPEFTLELLTKRIGQGSHAGYSILYFLSKMATKNLPDCRGQLEALLKRYPDLITVESLGLQTSTTKSLQTLFESTSDGWGKKLIENVTATQARRRTLRAQKLIDDLKIQTLQPNFSVTSLLEEYGLEIWLTPSREGRTALQLFIFTCSTDVGLKEIDRWWEKYFAALTLAQVCQVSTKGKFHGISLLWLAAEQAFKGSPRFWIAVMNKFKTDIKIKDLRSEAEDIDFKGMSPLWLIAGSTHTSESGTLWAELWQQFGPQITLADLRHQVKAHQYQGVTVLWHLTKALAEEVRAGKKEPTFNFKKEVFDKFPLNLGDLLSRALSGLYKNQSVVFLLATAAYQQLHLWQAVWKTLQPHPIWEHLILSVVGMGEDENQTALDRIAQAACQYPEIWPVVWNKISPNVTLEVICPLNRPSVLWHFARVMASHPSLWSTLWHKFGRQINLTHLLIQGKGAGDWSSRSALSCLASAAKYQPKIWMTVWLALQAEVSLGQLRECTFYPAPLWELALAGANGEPQIWHAVFKRFEKDFSLEDFKMSPPAFKNKSYTILYSIVSMAVKDPAARKQLDYLLNKFSTLLTLESLRVKESNISSLQELITSCEDVAWRERILEKIQKNQSMALLPQFASLSLNRSVGNSLSLLNASPHHVVKVNYD